jgi:DNA polymerase-3 subunit beta
MELTVTQENLAKALAAVSRLASTRTQLPILNNILLRTDGTRLLVAATNLEIAATHYIGAKIASHGSITIPARLVSEFVTSLPKGTVDLRVKGDQLTVTSGRYTSVINGVIADEFPELPTIDESSSIQYSITSEDFKQAVAQTIITASNDSTRPILTGVYWHSYEGFLYLVATDGYRLAERRLVKTTSDVAAIIPTQTLQEVLRTLTDAVDEVEVLFDETQVRFRLQEVEIVSRLIDGNFPNYRNLIPSESATVGIIKKDDFVRIARIAGLFARESGGGITLSLDAEKNILSIHSIASELGENTSEAEAEVSENGTITLNSRYLSDALSVIDGSVVEFSFNGKLSASVLKSQGDNVDYLHIIMPLKS